MSKADHEHRYVLSSPNCIECGEPLGETDADGFLPGQDKGPWMAVMKAARDVVKYNGTSDTIEALAEAIRRLENARIGKGE